MGTTELYYITKKQQHSFYVLMLFRMSKRSTSWSGKIVCIPDKQSGKTLSFSRKGQEKSGNIIWQDAYEPCCGALHYVVIYYISWNCVLFISRRSIVHLIYIIMAQRYYSHSKASANDFYLLFFVCFSLIFRHLSGFKI